ncbi:Uncharacterised protein [Candidatus Norongarragalina meridionalis]|nr:Uncharacterised protein [Candidatus Norongarragalina meridionalis]
MVEQQKGKDLIALQADVRSVETKIDLIVQKINTVEKNEEVIGRTIVAHNEKLKHIEEKGGGGGDSTVKDELEEELSKKFATKAEVQELKYVLDTVNPLSFATIDQVKELLDELKKELKKG